MDHQTNTASQPSSPIPLDSQSGPMSETSHVQQAEAPVSQSNRPPVQQNQPPPPPPQFESNPPAPSVTNTILFTAPDILDMMRRQEAFTNDHSNNIISGIYIPPTFPAATWAPNLNQNINPNIWNFAGISHLQPVVPIQPQVVPSAPMQSYFLNPSIHMYMLPMLNAPPNTYFSAQPAFPMEQACIYPQYQEPAPRNQVVHHGTMPIGPPGANLFIFHLPSDLDDLALHILFAPYGPIVSVKVYIDPQTRRSRGYGFVSYYRPESAELAIRTLDGFTIGNKRIKVEHKRSEAQAPRQ